MVGLIPYTGMSSGGKDLSSLIFWQSYALQIALFSFQVPIDHPVVWIEEILNESALAFSMSRLPKSSR